jgi:hypothetical protein
MLAWPYFRSFYVITVYDYLYSLYLGFPGIQPSHI